MSEHIKRGAIKHEDREVSYEWDSDDQIIGVWGCDECGDTLEVRAREGRHAYVEIGCGCGAESLDLRIADILDFEMGGWDTKNPMRMGRCAND